MFGFRYVLLSPHFVPESQIKTYNDIYASWRTIFDEVLEGMGGKLDRDDFFRFDYVGAILHGDKVVAHHHYSLFDLRLQSSKEHHFIASLDEATVEGLIAKGHPRILSLEYSAVLPDYRKSMGTTPWFEILTGLGLSYLDNSIANGLIGTPRTDVKADKMTYRLGAETLQPPLTKMNYECAVIYFPKLQNRTYENPETTRWVNQLWKSHTFISIPSFINKAA